MTARRRYAWIACFALLVHVLAMPLASGLSAETRQRLGWGPCPLTQALHAQHLADSQEEQSGDQQAHHASMGQCCCAGFSALLAPTAGAAAVSLLEKPTLAALPAPPPASLSPRHLWPALNPRASPSS